MGMSSVWSMGFEEKSLTPRVKHHVGVLVPPRSTVSSFRLAFVSLLLVFVQTVDGYTGEPRSLTSTRFNPSKNAKGNVAFVAYDRAFDHDPDATVDSYAELTEQEKDFWRRHSSDGSLATKINVSISNTLTQQMTIEIKLVGFDAEGAHGIRIGEREFAPYLESLDAAIEQRVLRGDALSFGKQLDEYSANNNSDDQNTLVSSLGINTKFHFHVTQASKSLNTAIERVIGESRKERDDDDDSSQKTFTVDASTVNNFIAEDRHRSSASYVMYVLNPEVGGDDEVEYAYTYGKSVGSCPGASWVDADRFMWIDLTSARSVEYGASSKLNTHRGDFILDGGVTPGVLPVISKQHAKYPHLVIPGIVAIIKRACVTLFAPGMDHGGDFDFAKDFDTILSEAFDPPKGLFADTITVNILRISDRSIDDENALRKALQIPEMEKTINAALSDGNGRDGKKKVSFVVTDVSFDNCVTCAESLLKATKDVTADDARTSITNQKKCVDSLELRKVLHSKRKDTKNEIGFDVFPGDENNKKSIPVILFDLSSKGNSFKLLDNVDSVVSLPEMVVGIRTSDVHFDHWPTTGTRCGRTRHGMSEKRKRNPNDISKALFAAILQTGWAIIPTHLYWSEAKNRIAVDRLFTTGNDPFGEVALGRSVGQKLPFHVSDALRRNELFQSLAWNVRVARRIVKGLSVIKNGDVFGNDYVNRLEFNGRWNSARYKLQKSLSVSGMGDFQRASWFAKSANVDIAECARFFFEAKENIKVDSSQSDCSDDDNVVWETVKAMVVAFIGVAVLVGIANMVWKINGGSQGGYLKQRLKKQF